MILIFQNQMNKTNNLLFILLNHVEINSARNHVNYTDRIWQEMTNYRKTRMTLVFLYLILLSCVLVTPPHERSDLSGHYGVCAYIWLVGWLVVNSQNFKNFNGSQKFQKQLSNIDFLTPETTPSPPPPPPQKNEITPDLA